MITSLHAEYFSKSRVFLYPMLDIKRDFSIKPIKTYTAWKGKYDHQDCKLICLYDLRDDQQFLRFEKIKLLGSPYFEEFHESLNKVGVYVFDFSKLKKDWDCYINGKYSQFSPELKTAVQKHFEKSNFKYHVDSFLNPKNYYEVYSDLLKCDIKALKDVGELCSKPDLELECVDIPIKQLTISN